MSMFPHTVTVYTVLEDKTTFQQIISITVLRGVLMDAAKGINVANSGLDNADEVNLYIPFAVEAVDGVTGKAKSFVSPKVFQNTTDKSGIWTLDMINGFFAKGEVIVLGQDYQSINKAYDDVYRISRVDEKDFGSTDMQHWEVGGK